VNVHEIVSGGLGFKIRNIWLDFGTDLDWDLDPGSFFHFSIIETHDVLGIKYEPKELRINVYNTFWRV